MAIGAMFVVNGASQDQYYQVFNQVMDHGQRRPPGLLSHHAGETAGGICVIETWESREAMQQFFEAELGAALQAANLQPQSTIFEIINSV